MNKCFLSFDLLGASPKIYYRGMERYQTSLGVTFTLLSSSFILGFVIYFFISYLKGEEMYIHSSYENNFTHFSLDLSNKGIRYKLVDSFNQEINHTILTVFPFLIEDNNSTITNVQLNTTKCDIADFLFRKDIIDETNNTKNYTCLSTEDNNNVINQSNITSNSYVSFYIAKCLNTTKNNRHCLSLEDIDIYLIRNKIYLLIYFEDNLVKHSSKIPFTSSFILKKIELDTSLYYKYSFSYQKVIYKSDNGIVFKNEKEYYSYIFENTNLLKVNLPNYQTIIPNTLMEINLYLNSNSAKYYYRTYDKFQHFLATTGGFIALTFKIVEGIIFLFTNGIMFTDILSSKENEKASPKDINSNKSPVQSNMNQSSSIDQIAKVENINTKQGLNISNTNNNIGMNFTKYTKYNKKEPIIQKKTKKKSKIKRITLWDSFFYSLICGKAISKRGRFIKYCELTVKAKLSSEEIIRTMNELEMLSFTVSSIMSSNSNSLIVPSISINGSSNKNNTSFVKENTNSLFCQEAAEENKKNGVENKDSFVI